MEPKRSANSAAEAVRDGSEDTLSIPAPPSASAPCSSTPVKGGNLFLFRKPSRVKDVSKSVAKKLWRQEMWKVKKATKKAAKRAARQETNRQSGEVGQDDNLNLQAATSESKNDQLLRKQRREQRKNQRHEAQMAFLRRCEEGARVVIDCGFDSHMTEKELNSLGQQLMYVYASNKRALAPCTVHIAELGAGIQQRLSCVAGVQNWQGFNRETQPYMETFAAERDKLVYLTSDSPNVLTQLDPGLIYVIGGIVDRNRLKHTTYNKALAQGIATARFPLREHVQLGSSPVLAVNHVFDILLEFQYTNDWRATFAKVLPSRKSVKVNEPAVNKDS